MVSRSCPTGLVHTWVMCGALLSGLLCMGPAYAADEAGEQPAAAAAAAEPAEPAAAEPAAADSKPAEGEGAAAASDSAPADSPAKADDHGPAEDHAGESPASAPHSPAAGHGDAAGHDDAAGHGSGGHGGHDDTDLTHVNATENLETVVEWKADLAIFTALVFLVLMLILGKFAYGPIVGGLDKREQTIEGMLTEARESSERAAAQLKAYEEQLAAAAEETREILSKAHRDAEAARERILAEAAEAAERQRARAVADIQAAKNVALSEVAQQGARIAVDLAGQIVRRELRPEDHTQLIQDALERFPSNN